MGKKAPDGQQLSGSPSSDCASMSEAKSCSIFIGVLCQPNALVQLQAQYHHRGEAASEKCLSAATFVRRPRRADRARLPKSEYQEEAWTIRFFERYQESSRTGLPHSACRVERKVRLPNRSLRIKHTRLPQGEAPQAPLRVLRTVTLLRIRRTCEECCLECALESLDCLEECLLESVRSGFHQLERRAQARGCLRLPNPRGLLRWDR